jgi:hypothetical protein
MSGWTALTELQVDIHRDEARAYAREQLDANLRRVGVTAEFTVATAVACWRTLQPEPKDPILALIWNSVMFAGTENMICLTELVEARDLPMPFQFIASQPHTAAVHAHRFLPGLAHATTLVQASADVDGVLLTGLAHRKPWTHVLLGEVWTPFAAQEKGDRLRARWRVMVRDTFPQSGRP